jgi:hypothetical protein
VGGFECYLKADEASALEAAEVYDGGDNDDDDQILSVPAAANTMNLVLREPGTMRFVKYVSAAAPGSRWDAAAVYEVQTRD